jgi:group I intron endonuclease
MKTGIYAITSPSGARYVGSAVSFAGRWNAHRHQLRRGTHHSVGLQRAFNKYGEGTLVFSKLIVCAPGDLLMYEQIAIDATPRAKLYNSALSAGSMLGFKHSDETKAKWSAARRGMKRPRSPEHTQKIADARRGKHLSAQARANQSEAQANRFVATSASGFVGVSRSGDRWRARARIQGLRINLGVFATAEEAHAAVQAATVGGP